MTAGQVSYTPGCARGFSLMEVVVALAVLALGLVSLGPLLLQSAVMIRDAAAESRAVVAASSRLEQLSALVHEQESSTLTLLTDEQTDLSTVPAGRGGSGLAAGASASAWIEADGLFDGVCADGGVAGGRGDTTTVRRWAVSEFPGAVPGGTRLLHVFAASAAADRLAAARSSAAPRPGDVWLFGVRARTLR